MKPALRVTHVTLLIALLILTANAQAQSETEACGLVVRGRVTDLLVDRRETNAVYFQVKLDVEFVNEGERPIILFKPDIENRYWLGGWTLFMKSKESEELEHVFGDGYWQSVSGAESYRQLAKGLDVDSPPADLTRILQPKESWKFADDFRIYFEAEKSSRFPVHRTWKEMQKLGSVFQLKIAYELSPWNVEYFKPDLIRKLRKRWASQGRVLVEKEKDGRFNHFIHVSESMAIDFSRAKEEIKN